MRIQKQNGIYSGLFTSNTPSESLENHVPELKKNIKKESKTKDTSWRSFENQKAMRKSAEGDLGVNRVLNSGIGGEKSESQSMNFIGNQNQSSIWDSEKLQKLSQIATSDEISKQEKSDIQKTRAGWKESSLTELADNITKHSLKIGIEKMPVQDGSAGKRNLPTNNISIFDNNNFERIAEKTDGEKLKDKPLKAKDESWKKTGKSTKLDSMSFFDNLLSRLNKNGE